MEQQAGAAFLSHVLRSKDEAFLISFDVNVELLSDYTSNAHALSRAPWTKRKSMLAREEWVACPSGTPRGTLLYDAVLPGHP